MRPREERDDEFFSCLLICLREHEPLVVLNARAERPALSPTPSVLMSSIRKESQMKAIVYRRHGEPGDVLALEDVSSGFIQQKIPAP